MHEISIFRIWTNAEKTYPIHVEGYCGSRRSSNRCTHDYKSTRQHHMCTLPSYFMVMTSTISDIPFCKVVN